MQSQANRQNQSSYGPPFSHNLNHPRAQAFMSPDLAHGAAQYFDAQFNGQQPTYRDSTPDLTGPGWSNDLYANSSILGREFNYTVAELAGRGFPVPQPLYPNGYAMPSFQHVNPGQGQTNFAEHNLSANQLPGYPMTFSPAFQGAYATANHHDAHPVWGLNNCWISYAGQDELHVTVVLRRTPFT